MIELVCESVSVPVIVSATAVVFAVIELVFV